MELIAILENSETAEIINDLPELAVEVIEITTNLYKKVEYVYPWVGYLVLEDDCCVGTCAFKSAPQNNRVEIAYFTFPENEGQGLATKMVKELINIALANSPEVKIFALTLAQENASTKVLKKNGFKKTGGLIDPEDGPLWEWNYPLKTNFQYGRDRNDQ